MAELSVLSIGHIALMFNSEKGSRRVAPTHRPFAFHCASLLTQAQGNPEGKRTTTQDKGPAGPASPASHCYKFCNRTESRLVKEITLPPILA